MFWSWLASFLSGPLLGKALDAYKVKLAAGNTSEGIAADLATKEILLQQREMELQTQYRIAEIGHWYEPDKIMGYLTALLLGKLIVWDICLGWGTTNLHEGWMSGVTNLIVGFYFSKRGIENVARIIKR